LADVLDRLPPMLEIVGGAPAAPSATREDFGGFAATGDEDFKFADTEGAAPKEPSFRFASGNAPTATAASPAVAARPRPAKTAAAMRPRRKEKNALAEAAKVVIGGLVGLMLAQLILWWLPEPYQRDPAELGPKVGKYVPWIVPAEFRSPAGSVGGDGGSSRAASGGASIADRSGSQRSLRSTAGGEPSAATESEQNENASAKQDQGLEPSSLSPDPQLTAEESMKFPEDSPAALPGEPLSIPEPDVGLAPAGDVSLDALAPGALPSGGAAPDDVTLDGPHPPAPTDTSNTPDGNAATTLPQPTPPEPVPPEATAKPTETPPADESFLGVKDAPMYVKAEVSASLA
jgi:hypothetical protein